MSELLQQIRDNRRLQLGLALIGLMLWVLGLLDLNDRVQASRAEAERLASDLARLESLQGQTQWLAFRDDVKTARSDLLSGAWREESEGRLQAVVQDWLRGLLSASGLAGRELVVTVARPAGNEPAAAAPGAKAPDDWPDEARIVRARVSFDFQAQPLNLLLAGVADHPRRVWVSRLLVRNAAQRTVEIEVEALGLLGAKGAP